MIIRVRPEHHRRHPSSVEPSEGELRAMLVEAEQRRDSEMKGKSRRFLLCIGLPLFVAFIGTVGFSIVFEAARPPRPAPTPPVRTAEPHEPTDLDSFRPQAMRSGATQLPKAEWQMVDKGDISFAMQLLNFMQPPAKAENKNHGTQKPQ